MKDENTSVWKKTPLELLRRACGFYRNPPYIEEQLRSADILSAVFLSAVVACVEIWLIFRYIKDWVIPGKVESLGEFFHYTKWYWYLLAASVGMLIYSILYLKKKLHFISKLSRLFVFMYFCFGIYFGVITAMKDFSKGRMVTCFLTMLMWITVICVWRPFTSVLLTLICGGGFIWLINNYTFDKSGEQIVMSDADLINYNTFIIIILILEIAVYFQRYSAATKSYKLELAAITDDLTGIPNMYRFDTDAKEYAEKCLKEEHAPMYLVFDISNFHTFNDRYGYTGGDKLLRETGRIIGEEFPEEPYARDSGDIFAVLTDRQDHMKRIDNVRTKVNALYPEESYLDIKVGAYRAEDNSKDARHAVDRALYALGSIKNREDVYFREYDEKMGKDYALRQYVLNHIDDAVKNGYIKVYYQPVVNSEDGTLCGCEALARWIDPNTGFLSPGVFIPVLEEGRQIHKLDLCIYDQVCKRIRDCMDSGLPVIPTSMNFSRLDFELMDAVGELEALVKKYDIPKHSIHVEITESALTEDDECLKTAIDKLHEGGYVIWLDDFGSGYSSMNLLKDFRFDLLKIDMEFLRNFNGNERSRNIIGSIIDLTRSLDMMTLSEGVETQEAVDFLKEAGCGRLQGYFYGKPMPYEDILAKIEDGTYTVGKEPTK